MQTLILNHYPPVIRQIREIQKIAKAEDIQFSILNANIAEVIRNMFVYTADESGIARFERMLGITPQATQSLEDRKVCIIFQMNRQKMSLSELTTMLSGYCEGIRLINDIANMEMIVEVGASTVNIHTINDILEEILPLNIYFRFTIRMGKAQINAFALQKAEWKLKVKSLLDTATESFKA